MTSIKLKRKCDEVGLYCLAIERIERERERFQFALKPKVSMEGQRTKAKKSVGMG